MKEKIMDIKKFIAFTLAETLIVMGIIGVVAALTLPNLNQNTANKEKVTKLKKVYSNLQDAYGRAVASYGPVDSWFIEESNKTGMSKKAGTRFADFLKTSKVCGTVAGGVSDCFTVDNEDGGSNVNIGEYTMTLADGADILFSINSKSCNSSTANTDLGDVPEKHLCGSILVDVDGKKGKNTGGYDQFLFHLTSKGIIPAGDHNDIDGSDGGLRISCFSGFSIWCTAWIIESGTMDYLKATNGTCKNGTVLSWSNLTCK